MQDLKFSEWLNVQEMALRKMQLVPPHNPDDPKSAWGPKGRKYGWDDTDRKLVTSEGGVKKFTKLFANTEFDFEFYLVRSKEASKHIELGEVTPEWVRTNIPQMANYEPAEDAVNVIFTNNTGAEKMHFSAWTAAHRFGHVLNRSRNLSTWSEFTSGLQKRMEEILQNHYNHKPGRSMYGSSFPDQKTEKLLGRLATNMGTMRSARQDNLRNYFEFAYELMAQFLTTKNKVQFNGQLERMLATKFAWGRPSGGAYQKYDADKEEIAADVEYLADYCNDMLDYVMQEAVGRTFVM